MDEEMLKRKVVGALLSLSYSWTRQVVGPEFSPLLARLYACSPSPIMFRHIWAAWHDVVPELNLQAFSSPSYRRRFHDQMEKSFKNSPSLKEVRTLVSEAFRSMTGQEPDEALRSVQLDRIPSFADIEREFRATAEIVAQHSEEFIPLVPMDEAIDPRLRHRLLEELGGDAAYSETMLETLILTCLDPLYLRDGLNTRKALLLFRLSQKELEELDTHQAILLLCRKMWELSTISGDEALRFIVPVLGNILAKETLESPYSKVSTASLDTSIREGIRLLDVLSDDRATGKLDEVEAKRDWEILLRELPAGQRRSAEIYLEAMITGTPVKDICERDGEDYDSVRQNWSRITKKHHC